MKEKTKKRIWGATKVIWWIIGCLILTWIINFFILTQLNKESNSIAYPLLFGIGITFLIIYFVISTIAILTKYIIREIKVKNISEKATFTKNTILKTPEKQPKK